MENQNFKKWTEEEKEKLRIHIVFSYIVSFIILGLIMLKYLFDSGSSTGFINYNTYSMLFMMLFFLILYFVTIYLKNKNLLVDPTRQSYFLYLLYVSLITVLIYSISFTNFFVKILYFIPIILGAINFNRKFGLYIAGYSAVSVFVLNYITHNYINFDFDIILILLFFWVAWIIGSFANLERKINNQLEEEKNQSKDRLVSMGSLVATTIHDMRNPLSVVKAVSQLGKLKTNSKKDEEYYSKIIHQIENLSEMLENILYVHKPEEFIHISPGEILNDVIEELKPLCQTKNIELIFINQTSLKTSIRVKLFKRAINNLVINAVNSITGKGKIEVKINGELDDDFDKNILITIKDNGPGIPDDIKESIFQPFVNKREGGTGLGLYMVHQAIIEVHDGEIWFETEKNHGTSFFIKLPVK